jgi:GNAT superfamily N-acetyltransferase
MGKNLQFSRQKGVRKTSGTRQDSGGEKLPEWPMRRREYSKGKEKALYAFLLRRQALQAFPVVKATPFGQAEPETRELMSLELELQQYPKEIRLKDGASSQVRPLNKDDEKSYHQFFLAVPESERMFIKHRVTQPEVIREWCQHIDFHRNLPLLALMDSKIVGAATLHQHLGGWKRHIGRVSVLVLSQYRGRGLARALIREIVALARELGLEKVEAEFIGEQEAAIKMFALLGFSNLVRLESYVKDMQAISHDYVLMGLDLKTDEEYAGVG